MPPLLIFLILRYNRKDKKVMKKVFVLLMIAIGFINLDFVNVKMTLLSSFIGGIGLGLAVIEARLVGRKEGSEE